MKTIVLLLVLSSVLALLNGCRFKEPELMADYWATYDSMDEFTEAYKAARRRQKSGEELTQDDNLLFKIDTVYQPAFDLPEYTLYHISVGDYNLRYWYCPNDIEYSNNTTLNELLYITFYHPKEGVDQFEQAVQQYRKQNQIEPTADGVIYDATNRYVYFRVGTSYGYVAVPESMNTYETILPLCQYEVLEITETE